MLSQTLYKIFKSGYSRIPVFDKDVNDILGLLLAKDLIFVDPEVCSLASLSVFTHIHTLVVYFHFIGGCI